MTNAVRRPRSVFNRPPPQIAVRSSPPSSPQSGDSECEEPHSVSSLMAVTIDQLPTEILILIFTSFLNNFYPTISLHRTTLALVSRRWASVCYDTGEFWTTVHYNDTLASVSLALIKSGDAPLSLFLKPMIAFRGKEFTIFQLSLAHLHRWRRAQIRIGRTDLKGIEESLNAPAPLLEELDILAHRNGSHSRAGIFRHGTPNLKVLQLTDFVVPWDSPLYSGLTVLELIRTPGKEQPQPSQVLSILSNCPQLTIFTLHALNEQDDPAEPSRATLPLLTSIDLRGEPPGLLHLLRHLDMPSLERFHLRTVLMMENQEVIPQLIPFFPLVTHGDLVISLDSLDVECAVLVGSSTIWQVKLEYTYITPTLNAILDNLPASLLNGNTKVALQWWSYEQIEEFLATVEARLFITSFRIHDDQMCQAAALASLSKPIGGRWPMPHLEELIVRYPTLEDLRVMVELRHAAGMGEAGEAVSPKPPAPTPLKRLQLLGEEGYRDSDISAVKEMLGNIQR